MRNFGVGGIYLIPSGANPTPIEIAILKDITVDIPYQLKPLRGQWQAPIDMARGALDIKFKAKFADIRASLLTALVVGATSAANNVKNVFAEVGTIPTTPFQVTVANSANFKEDAGVFNASTQTWMTRVAAGPIAGQYSVAAGVYTFSTADNVSAPNVQIYYSYNFTTTTGQTTTFNNTVMGVSTGYLTRVWNIFNGKPLGLYFPNVHFPKLSMALKAEDWVEHDIEGVVAQDTASAKVFDIYTGE